MTMLTAKQTIDRGYHPIHGSILFYQHMGLGLDDKPRIAIKFISGFSFFGFFDQTI